MKRQPLVKNPDRIRLGIIGMTPGNGHPYSWSAILNGYDREAMTRLCPYPGIIGYLGKEDVTGVPGVEVSMVHASSSREDAEAIAAASRIGEVVDDPAAMIGKVDAVIIATDIGSEHVERARPFVEAGVPLLIDKPLCDNAADLATFERWIAGGAKILSSSSMRYSKEFRIYHRNSSELGKLRHIFMQMSKYWETYGIHALEAVYPILGPGFVSARNCAGSDRDIVVYRHRDGCTVTIACIRDIQYGAPMVLGGTAGVKIVAATDTYQAFRDQLLGFVGYLRTGTPPFDFGETRELMKMLIAGIESRNRGGEEVLL